MEGKLLRLFLFSAGLGSALFAQEATPTIQSTVLTDKDDISSGRSEIPSAHVFQVESARTLPLPDRNVTVRRVAPPVLEQQPEPAAEVAAEFSTEEVGLSVTGVEVAPSEYLLISATVYQDRLTRVSGWSLGKEQQFTAWTDIDFNDFCGMGGFTHGGTQYGLIMGIGNDASMPTDAVFPAKYGGFRFVSGETPETLRIAEAFSSYHAAHWEALAAARRTREAAAKLAAAAPPRPPSDITISVWDKPSRPLTAAEKAARDAGKEAAR